MNIGTKIKKGSAYWGNKERTRKKGKGNKLQKTEEGRWVGKKEEAEQRNKIQMGEY